jgi:hypothetical protein
MEDGTSMAMDYNYFTINGKSFPATEPLVVEEGDVVRVRLINPSQTIHPMHLHGQDFKVVAKDGEPLKEPWIGNTLPVLQGETYDIVFIANNPGVWAFHCHDLHHTANDGVEPGGLMVLVQYEGYEPVGGANQESIPSEMPGSNEGMGQEPVPSDMPAPEREDMPSEMPGSQGGMMDQMPQGMPGMHQGMDLFENAGRMETLAEQLRRTDRDLALFPPCGEPSTDFSAKPGCLGSAFMTCATPMPVFC